MIQFLSYRHVVFRSAIISSWCLGLGWCSANSRNTSNYVTSQKINHSETTRIEILMKMRGEMEDCIEITKDIRSSGMVSGVFPGLQVPHLL